MRFRLNNLRVGLDNERELQDIAARKLGIAKDNIGTIKILRRAVDARRKNNICLVYHLELELRGSSQSLQRLQQKNKDLQPVVIQELPEIKMGQEALPAPPVVVGAGPGGLVATLILARAGYKPLLLERGKDLEARLRDVEHFWRSGEFNPASNVQFGLGGAGTFSDGKLTTRVNDPLMDFILRLFVEAGAPSSILYEHKPHVGTDELRKMVAGLVQSIEEAGGSIRYETQVTDLIVQDEKVTGVITGNGEKIKAGAVLLAIGHSARDTYAMLHNKGVAMESKDFAIGLRVEHAQELIDRAQYGDFAGHRALGAADYTLIHHCRELGRTAYSFCMCPGGMVVASASEEGGVVTNGMSNYHRDSGSANSALVVNVGAADWGGSVLGGIEFQRHYEQLAFAAGGRNYRAPAQNVRSFLEGNVPALDAAVSPSYRPGVVATDLASILPDYVGAALREGIRSFDKKITGFASAGVLTGVETRTSAPVRIIRGKNGESVSHANLYPVGEGAGYAGGIMSAALDGYHAAEKVMERFRRP